jgi:aryl-alcohol dehydrogenase-like predicted oxidoreductase
LPQDNANIYSNGESERIFGKAIKKYSIPRDKLVIMTKCFNPVGERPEIFPDEIRDQQDPNYTNKGGLSRLAIFNQVNAVSLIKVETFVHWRY